MDYLIKLHPSEVLSTWIMGFVGVAAPLAFLVGFFASIPWLLMLGGIALVGRDAIGIFIGVLNPAFPIILAIVLAFFISPWFVGVFWASAVFAILGMPFHLRQVIFPRAATRDAMRAEGDVLLRKLSRGG